MVKKVLLQGQDRCIFRVKNGVKSCSIFAFESVLEALLELRQDTGGRIDLSFGSLPAQVIKHITQAQNVIVVRVGNQYSLEMRYVLPSSLNSEFWTGINQNICTFRLEQHTRTGSGV